jgi:hypothetical protein
MSTAFYDDGNHAFQPYEQDANRRAFMYFNKNVEGFYQTGAEYYNQGLYNISNGNTKGWNFYRNPLDVYHIGKNSRYDYYDYHNPAHRDLVNSLSLSAKWYDYAGWLGGISGALGVGIWNGLYYNNHRVR